MKEENASLRKILRDTIFDDAEKGEEDDDEGLNDQAPPRHPKNTRHPRKEKPATTQPPATTSAPKSIAEKEAGICGDVRKHLLDQMLDAGMHIDDANDPKMQEFFLVELAKDEARRRATES